MCGIVGFVGKRACADILVKALKRLEYRGYDSAGISVMQNGKITAKAVSVTVEEYEAFFANALVT